MTTTIPGDLDPEDYPTSTAFKTAVYDEAGAGTWLDDIKLEIVWRRAHGEELEDYMEPLIAD